MDFSNRGFQAPGRSNAPNQVNNTQDSSSSNSKGKRKMSVNSNKFLNLLLAVLLIGVVVIIVAVALGVAKGNKQESSYVNSDKYQAVFLNGGQVYFGKIKAVNADSIDLQDIYYLNVPSGDAQNQSSNNNISLVKLGCELHGPADQMVVYRDQVTFWENLTDNGKVVSAIKEWQKQNPNGQDCSKATSQQQPPASDSTSQNPSSSTNNDNSSSSNNNSTR